MNTLIDWARFYADKRLWIYPCNLKENEWLFWKNLKSNNDYDREAQLWDWDNSDGIKLIVGKKGVRVLEVTSKQTLKKALTLLELPKDYPWIIYSQSRYGIIVDTPGVSKITKGIQNKSFKKLSILWEGYYMLPSTGIPRYFYKNLLPQSHPKQISDDILINCFEKLVI